MKPVTQQQIVLRGNRVDYDVVVSKGARQSRIRVGPGGVEVLQPAGASEGDVSGFLRRKRAGCWPSSNASRVFVR